MERGRKGGSMGGKKELETRSWGACLCFFLLAGMSYTFEIYDPEKEKAGMVAREGENPGDV